MQPRGSLAMIDDRDRRIAWLELELGFLRTVSAEALAAYRAIGMGRGGYTARDRDAFANLDAVLRRPVEEVRPEAGEDEAWAGNAVRLLLACEGPAGPSLSGPTWQGIVGEAALAVPGLRQAIARTGSDVARLMPEEERPAILAAAEIVHLDATRGFPGPQELDRLLGIARAVPDAPALPGPGA